MYKFNMIEKFPCEPRALFERTMRNFDEYAEFSPDVKRVEELSREKLADGREKITIRVFANNIMPAPVRMMFKMSGEMDWKESYIVDMEKPSADWNVETPIFNEYVDCCGTSWFREVPGGCEIVITGAMKIEAPPIPGIPTSVVRGVIEMIEPFVGKMVTMNLQKYFKSIRACVEKEARLSKRVANSE